MVVRGGGCRESPVRAEADSVDGSLSGWCMRVTAGSSCEVLLCPLTGSSASEVVGQQAWSQGQEVRGILKEHLMGAFLSQ